MGQSDPETQKYDEHTMYGGQSDVNSDTQCIVKSISNQKFSANWLVTWPKTIYLTTNWMGMVCSQKVF